MPKAPAKPRAPRLPDTFEPDEGQFPVVFADDEQVEETPEDRLLSIVAEQIGSGDGDEGSVTIFKFNEEKKREWVDKMSASDFQSSGIPMIAKRHGGGEYEIYVYGPTETGGRKIIARQRVTISKTATPLRETENGSIMTPELQSLFEMQKRTEQMLQTLAGAVMQSRDAVTQPGAQPFSLMQHVQELVALKQLFGGEHAAPAMNPVDMFRSMAEVFKEMQPGDGEPSLVDTVSKFADKFGPLIQQALSAQPQTSGMMPPQMAARPMIPGAQPNMVKPQPQPQQPPTGEQNMQFFQHQMMKFYLAQFVDTAASNGDPYPWAAIVVDKVPEETLREWLSKPSLAQELAKIDPRVLQFQTWFNELQAAIKEILETPPDDEESAPELTGAQVGVPGVPAEGKS